MEIDSASCSLVLAVADAAHVDGARRAIIRQATRLTQDEDLLGRITVVVQEMGRNLINHAGQGELVYRQSTGNMEIIARDNGPGMGNVAKCLVDHYSTTGTMGVGLGAIQRMSDRFDVFSQPGAGTVVYAGFNLAAEPERPLSVGAVCSPYPGEDVSGDTWTFKGRRVMVCDGLGHGRAAHAASQRAREVFEQHDEGTPLPRLMEQLHRALMSTRGGAVALAEIQPEAGQVEFCSVGNVAGVLFSGKNRSMVSSNGTVGYRMGRINTFTYPWDPSTLLIMTSDGISTKLDLAPYPGLLQRHPAVVAALIHRDFRRLNDDATVVVARVE